MEGGEGREVEGGWGKPGPTEAVANFFEQNWRLAEREPVRRGMEMDVFP